MVFWVVVALTVITAVLCFMGYHNYEYLAMLLSIILALMMVVLVVTYLSVDGFVAKSLQRYESLVYQAQHDLYENDNDVGKKELVNQIQDWNEDLAGFKAKEKDVWLGIFYPNIFDRFEFIPLDFLH